jgi:hypothetical protein
MLGVEGTGSYGAGLTGYLGDQQVSVVEVDRPDRRTRRQQGKSDRRPPGCQQSSDRCHQPAHGAGGHRPAPVREALDGRPVSVLITSCARLRPDQTGLSDPAHASKAALQAIAHRIQLL